MPDLFVSREQAESDLLAAAAFIAERIKSSDGHAEAMTTVVPLYLERDDVDLAAELANAVADPHSRDKLLIKVAEKCAIVDDDEYALQLADAIEDHGLRSEAFERIGFVNARQGNTAAALGIADMMNHPDLVYSAVAVQQAAGGDEAGADETLARLEFFSARTSALQSIADAHTEKGNTEKAIQALEAAAMSAEEIEHDEERIRTLSEIGNHFIEAARKDLALEIFEKARSEAEVVDNVHRDLLLVMCSIGFLEAGDEERAEETLDLISDKTQLASALLVFSRNAWRNGEKEDAVDELEETVAILDSQRESEIRDSRARNGLLSSIAVQFAVFEKSERAIDIAQNNPDEMEQWSAISQIAQILTLQKNDVAARGVLDLIESDPEKVSALIMISDAKQRLGEADTAVAMLDEAVSLAETLPQHVAFSSAMIEIASRFAAHGLIEKVRTISIANLQKITEIRDESSQAAAVASLSEVYSKAGLEIGDEERALISRLLARS
jgi:tetratricopeptide (TPR) repeat protein